MKNLKIITITRKLKSPPVRLIKNAVVPRVIKAKNALNKVTAKPYFHPNVLTQNIVTILENPGFTAGMGTMGGMRDSRNESAVARAQNIPVSAITPALLFFRRTPHLSRVYNQPATPSIPELPFPFTVTTVFAGTQAAVSPTLLKNPAFSQVESGHFESVNRILPSFI